MPNTVSDLARKLHIKEGVKACIVNAPPGYVELLAPLPEGASVTGNTNAPYAFMQFFASQRSEIVKSLPAILKRAGENAFVWIAYPKTASGVSTDLNRDKVREIVAQFGWHTVSIISVDPVWAALRIRPGQE